MPVPGRATPSGTADYAQSFHGRSAPTHFRKCQQLTLSSVGLGTYLGECDEATDHAYTEAVERALELGVNVVDSAINYRFQRSERSVGRALGRLIGAGKLRREEVVVCTKAGFLTPDGAMPGDPRRYFQEQYIARGVLPVEEVAAGMHCMAPAYLADQLERSLRNLDLRAIDVFYLHNPETQIPHVAPEEFHRRLRKAFEFLEQAVNQGSIGFYGTATWNGYRHPPKTPDHLSLEKLHQLAIEIAGQGHHFRFVQLPYSLAMPEALSTRSQTVGGREMSLVEAAATLGITVIASASLMQAQLSRGLPEAMSRSLPGLQTDAQRAIQFVRSSPGIAVALVGMSHSAHVEENLGVAAFPPVSREQFLSLFQGD